MRLVAPICAAAVGCAGLLAAGRAARGAVADGRRPPGDALQFGTPAGPFYALRLPFAVNQYTTRIAPESGHCSSQSRHSRTAFGGRTWAQLGVVRTGSRTFVGTPEQRCHPVLGELRARLAAGRPPAVRDDVGGLVVTGVEPAPPPGWPASELLPGTAYVERAPAAMRRGGRPVYWFGPRVRAGLARRAVDNFPRQRSMASWSVTVFYERQASAHDGTDVRARPRGDVWVTTRPVGQRASRSILAMLTREWDSRVRLSSGERARIIQGVVDDQRNLRTGFTVVTRRSLVSVSARATRREAVQLAVRLRRLDAE